MSHSPRCPCRPAAGADLATPRAPDCHLPASGTVSTCHRRRGTLSWAKAVRRGQSPHRGCGNALRQQKAGPSLVPGGAGIAAETHHRLLLRPPLGDGQVGKGWPSSNRQAVFGAHHLPPADSMDRVSWQFPIPPLLASTLNDGIGGICLFGVASKRLCSDTLSGRRYYKDLRGGPISRSTGRLLPASLAAMRSAAPAMPMAGGSHVEIRGL